MLADLGLRNQCWFIPRGITLSRKLKCKSIGRVASVSEAQWLRGRDYSESLFNKGNIMNTKFKSLFLGLALALSTALVGHAQATKHPDATEPSSLNLKPGNGAGSTTDSSGVIAATADSNFNYGWHFVHPDYCETYYSGGYAYLVVYAKEGGYFYTTDYAYQNALYPACQTSNWVGFFVYNNSGNWQYLRTYYWK